MKNRTKKSTHGGARAGAGRPKLTLEPRDRTVRFTLSLPRHLCETLTARYGRDRCAYITMLLRERLSDDHQ